MPRGAAATFAISHKDPAVHRASQARATDMSRVVILIPVIDTVHRAALLSAPLTRINAIPERTATGDNPLAAKHST